MLKTPAVFWFALVIAGLVILYLLTRRPSRPSGPPPDDTISPPPKSTGS